MIAGFVQANISVSGLHTSTRQFYHTPCRWARPQVTGIACPSAVVRAYTADATDHWKQHQRLQQQHQFLKQQQQQQGPAVANTATPLHPGELEPGQDLSDRQHQPVQRSPAHGMPRKAAAGRGPGRVLRALCHYAPMDLSDGPASLSKVRPYDATEVQQALDHATHLLPKLGLQQMSNIAGALAAAGHYDSTFMQRLGDAAAARLKATPRLMQHTQGLQAFRIICWLAVGFSRLGVLHVDLLEQIALYGTHLLQRCPLQFTKRRHGQQMALLAAAYAALKLYPPQLYKAIGEHLKQHRQVVKLLGPQESMLLLWAFTRTGHQDPPAQLLITQRATTQVGQLTCAGLAHAYSQCAAAGIRAAPLLAALRKATRAKLTSMQPGDLTALLTALAAMGQQDLLYLDEIARAVFNKLANFTAAEISTSLTALGVLRYRNSWLLDQTSKILVSHKLRRAHQLTPEQLADVLGSCSQLSYLNPLLLSHLGSVAAVTQLPGCSPAQLAAIVQGYTLLGFQQPQLLQAAATRLLQLVTDSSRATEEYVPALQHAAEEKEHAAPAADQGRLDMQKQGQGDQQQPQQHQDCHSLLQVTELSQLISAALQLCAMPSAAGTSAERAVLPAALLGITAHTLAHYNQQQQDSGSAQDQGAAGSSSQDTSTQCMSDCISLHTALLLLSVHSGVSVTSMTAAAAAAAAVAAAGRGGVQQQQQGQVHVVLQEVLALQHELEQLLGAALAAHAAAGRPQQLSMFSGLLPLMQLLWLAEQSWQPPPPPHGAAGLNPAAADLPTGEARWRLGLPPALADVFVQQRWQQYWGQQQQLQGIAAAIRPLLQKQVGKQQLQQEEVQVLHQIPGTPIIIPVALLPQVQTAEGSDEPQQEARAATSPNQPQQQDQPEAFLQVEMSLQGRRLQLPAAAQSFLDDCRRSKRPLAVFIHPAAMAATAAAGTALGVDLGQAWHTSNDPQQVLPAALIWQKGLQAAGWSILLLQDEGKNDTVGG